MSAVLVTGGAGFIGANLVRFLRAHRPDSPLVVLDALTYAGNRASIAGVGGVELVHGDIRETALVERLLTERGADTIVHLAAESHVDRSIAAPGAFIQTNVVGTYSLLEAARAAWLDTGSGRPHRFHHVSTDEVFGSLDPAAPASTEEAAYAPSSPYAASKAASDHLVRAWHRTYGLCVTTSNCSNNYGPFQYPEKLVPLFIGCALDGRPMPIYGDGRQVREWLHVEDHCRGIAAVLDHGRTGETYNLGGTCELPNIEVADAICAAVDAAFARDPDLAARFPDAPAARGRPTAGLKTHVADRPGHDRRYALDGAKAGGALGFAPARSFATGLPATVAWYIANEEWWRPLQARADRGRPGR